MLNPAPDTPSIVSRAYATSFAGAALFGISSPLLAKVDWGAPRMAAALLYGSYGALFALLYRPWQAPVATDDRRWFGASLLFGGVLAPLFLMTGLASISGAAAPLWLGAEPLITVLLGILFFKEPSSVRLWISLVLFLIAGSLLAQVEVLGPGVTWLLLAAAA